jgi:hypothetical protein
MSDNMSKYCQKHFLHAPLRLYKDCVCCQMEWDLAHEANLHYDTLAKLHKAETQLEAVRGLKRYTVISEASDSFRLKSIDETDWSVGTVVLNDDLQAALNGEADG